MVMSLLQNSITEGNQQLSSVHAQLFSKLSQLFLKPGSNTLTHTCTHAHTSHTRTHTPTHICTCTHYQPIVSSVGVAAAHTSALDCLVPRDEMCDKRSI